MKFSFLVASLHYHNLKLEYNLISQNLQPKWGLSINPIVSEYWKVLNSAGIGTYSYWSCDLLKTKLSVPKWSGKSTEGHTNRAT